MSDEQRVIAIKSLERRTREQLSFLAQAVEASRGINEMMNVQLDRHEAKIDRLKVINADLLAACEVALEIISVYDEGVGLTLEERALERTILAAIAKARGE